MRTKEAIIHAFLSLLENKNLDKITIKAICAETGLTRNSFYYYFSGIGELLEAALQKLQADFQVQNCLETASLEECLANVADLLKDNRQKIRHLNESKYRDVLLGWVEKEASALLSSFVSRSAEEMCINPDKAENIARIYAYSLNGLFLCWMQADTYDHAKSELPAFLQCYSTCLLSAAAFQKQYK